ncbi:MAG: RNA polymerase sigma-32 factor [Alphaproteobacteria bacterium]|jgi:RNA polymerase sigma-32 factor
MASLSVALIPDIDNSLSSYLSKIKKFPMLEPEQEQALAHDMHENKNIESAHKLITSHLRLVVSVAVKFKGYGLPIMDLIAEGNIGLMRAVKKFDLSKGYRLSTYALWWIRASIQDYILKSWSLVKIGTTTAQKKLFFSLNRLKRKLNIHNNAELHTENVTKIAHDLNVPDYEVVDMNRRLGGHDASLNVPAMISEENSVERQDFLVDKTPNQEIMIVKKDEDQYRQNLVAQALDEMPERDRNIIVRRRIDDPPTTLEVLSQEYGISRERVRQIEDRAFKNLKEKVLVLANPKVHKQIEHHS